MTTWHNNSVFIFSETDRTFLLTWVFNIHSSFTLSMIITSILLHSINRLNFKRHPGYQNYLFDTPNPSNVLLRILNKDTIHYKCIRLPIFLIVYTNNKWEIPTLILGQLIPRYEIQWKVHINWLIQPWFQSFFLHKTIFVWCEKPIYSLYSRKRLERFEKLTFLARCLHFFFRSHMRLL